MTKTNSEKQISLFWFRRDLRLEDNAGLYHALRSEKPVRCLFIFDSNILSPLQNKNDLRVQFIHRELTRLNHELQRHGSSLMVFHGQPEEIWQKLIRKHPVSHVFANHDYEPYAADRDQKIRSLLLQSEIPFSTYKDQTIFEKHEVTKDDGSPYTVFTPYKKKWLKNLDPYYLKRYPTEKYFSNFDKTPAEEILTLDDIGFGTTEFDYPTRSVRASVLTKYDQQRDYPGLAATSKLGVHLRFGTVSIRHSTQIAQKTNDTWLSELIWRDFFMQILFHFPHVTRGAFRPEYDKIRWRNDPDEFKAWKSGMTGYPMVDAGMRELNSTGFMHNRARMITASFLAKHLLIDWRWGERYFAEKLLDFDLSANNGNWQWAAGTGCDAAPYFRVFNPSEQQKKFDPKFDYIKKWISEWNTNEYPNPIVDHKIARDRALKTYRSALRPD